MANRINVDVEFTLVDGKPHFTYSSSAKGFEPGPPTMITVPADLNLVVFKLRSPQPDVEAVFILNPFQYIDEANQPSPSVPSGFVLERNSGNEVTLIDINTTEKEERFRFFLIVLATYRQGGGPRSSIFGDDPTLINVPAGPPGTAAD